ncbi:MAG TPA: NAD(P)/FAD-dependent oxidoreductase, partial [Sphingomonadales bacterium]|nr:NAD(P)/FAD-dependent oxidoreductase [Sphingomonadales bacterium]
YGVELESGAEIKARAVAANVGPKLLYLKMVDGEDLPPDFRARMQHFSVGSGVFRMNVALAELPQFACLKDKADIGDFMTAGIIIAPSIEYMDRAYRDAREQGWSREPIVEMLISSALDDTLCPKGNHVASLFCQQFRYDLPGGKSWPLERDRCADLIIETVTKYAPNFKKSVLGRQVLSPLDLEQKFGLVGGDIFHGRLSLDQMFSARPLLGYADYRSPIKGLYLCGSGAHPGGGVTGAPGHNAAREILRDL